MTTPLMQASTEDGQYLTFVLDTEEYAVGILSVREIIEFDSLTRIPSAPAHIRGAINLRGRVVPVVDLAVRFGLGERPVTRRTCIVIVEASLGAEPIVVGLLVDAVRQVVDLGPDDIEPPPPFGTRARLEHLVGLGKADTRFLLILDVDNILSPDGVHVGDWEASTVADA